MLPCGLYCNYINMPLITCDEAKEKCDVVAEIMDKRRISDLAFSRMNICLEFGFNSGKFFYVNK